MNKKINETIYRSPSVECMELVLEGSILNMSGGTIGVDGWDEDSEDYGGSAT